MEYIPWLLYIGCSVSSNGAAFGEVTQAWVYLLRWFLGDGGWWGGFADTSVL